MKSGVLAARQETANRRLLAAADEIGKRLDIDTSSLEALEANRGPVALQGLYQSEAVADLLDQVLAALPDLKKATAKPTAKKKAAAK